MTDQQWLAAVLTAIERETVVELRVLADCKVENAPLRLTLPLSEAEISDKLAWEASCHSGSALV